MLESPTTQVEFLFVQLTERNVRLYLVPSAIEPWSIQCLKKSCDFLVMWYKDPEGQSSSVTLSDACSINLTLHNAPRDKVKKRQGK